MSYSKPFPFIDSQHALAITPDDNLLAGDSVQFVFTNLSGLVRQSSSLVVQALPTVFASWPLNELPDMTLPNGNLMPKQAVWNDFNRPDVVLNVYDAGNAYDSLWMFEWGGTAFYEKLYFGKTIPHDARDITGDGIPELMAGIGGVSRIYSHSTQFTPLPERLPDPDIGHTLIPRDSGGYYGAGLFDFDPNDRTGNYIIRHNTTYEVWTVNWNNNGRYTPELDATIHNSSRGANGLGRPRFRLGNIIGDGTIVGLWGDTDGDIILSKRISATSWQNIWSDSLGEGDATDYLDVGDFDGDGVDEFVAGYQTASRVTSEHEAPLRKWAFYLYKWIGGRPQRVDSLTIDGANDPRLFDAGVESGDLDGDGKKEIFISASPYLLVLHVDPVSHRWRIVYQAMDCRSNTVALFNMRNNGRQELVYNTGGGFKFLEWGGSLVSSPLVPSGFIVQPLDTSRIQLTWNPVPSATSYRIIRGVGSAAFDTIMTVNGTSFLDSLATDTLISYRYAVAAYDSAFAQPLGSYSAVIAARPNHPPQILSAHYEPDNFIRLIFSEPVGSSVQFPNRFRLDAGTYPVSILPSHAGAELLLRFDPRPDTGNHVLTVGAIFDHENTPLAGLHAASVNFPMILSSSYFLSDVKLQNGTIIVTMSLPYDPATLSVAAFRVTPNISIERVDAIDSVSARLIAETNTPVGALGIIYQVSVLPSLHALNGQPLNETYASRAISTQPDELQPLFVYPNPARPDRGEQIVISGLPRDTKVTVYTLSGLAVKKLVADPSTGGATWDGTNGNGSQLSAGVYILVAEKNGKVSKGKVAIIR